VLLHAISDALLGAISLGDIGKHFPDSDPSYKNTDSSKLLSIVWQMVNEVGYRLGNIDATLIAQAPKMAPYIVAMSKRIAPLLDANVDQISIKATTTENLGFIGRLEGIGAMCVAILIKN